MLITPEQYKTDYNNKVKPYIPKSKLVYLRDNQIYMSEDFAARIVKVKLEEIHHLVDSGSEFERQFVGRLCECIVENYFNIKFIDWTIGPSGKYFGDDLESAGYKCGVKGVKYGNFHLVPINPKSPQIIVTLLGYNRGVIHGMASIELMKNNQSIIYVKSDNLRARNVKTAFTGYKLLNPLFNLPI